MDPKMRTSVTFSFSTRSKEESQCLCQLQGTEQTEEPSSPISLIKTEVRQRLLANCHHFPARDDSLSLVQDKQVRGMTQHIDGATVGSKSRGGAGHVEFTVDTSAADSVKVRGRPCQVSRRRLFVENRSLNASKVARFGDRS